MNYNTHNGPLMSLYLTVCKRKIRYLMGGFWCYYSHKCDYVGLPVELTTKFIFVGDGNKVVVEAIGTFKLQLKNGFHLNLFETFVVSSSRQNIISISNLDKFRFSNSFGNNKDSLYQNSNVICFGCLFENL
ncbi:hypothetical protein CR513_50995, partial [Mucuna pruriens]